ncbi:MAG TPA: PP2C family serine/threonine-protein phosphatase [Polyangiaceae bacterium]|nr:PP2C family serine/threonine-protein phosphatase [Polyangiaceae bacterium]
MEEEQEPQKSAAAMTPEEPEPCASEETPPEITLALRVNRVDAAVWGKANECMLKLAEAVQALRIPHGQVGSPFAFTLDLQRIPGLRVQVCTAQGFDRFGLTVQAESGQLRVEGVPTEEFDGAVTLHIHYAMEIEARKTLTLLPDPRSLWKEIEPAADEGYPREHCAVRELAIPEGKRVLAASVRGRSHAHEGKFRDDAFALEQDLSTGWLYLAVADGAGSARFSRKGAEMACEGTIRFLRENMARLPEGELEAHLKQWRTSPEDAEARGNSQLDKVFHRALYDAWFAVNGEAEQRGAKMRDYYTTLLVAAVKRFDFGWFIANYWVGDGAVALLGADGAPEVRILGKPDGGEFAGETRFFTMKEEITEENIRGRLRYSFVSDFDALFLMTDGVSDPFFEAEADLFNPERWERLTADLEEKTRFEAKDLLEWLNFWSRGNHDDRTLVVVR